MVLTYLEKLRDLREDRDLTQKEVANMLGIAQTTYSQYELVNAPCPSNAWSLYAGITACRRTIFSG